MKIFTIILLGFTLLFGVVDINNADKKELMRLKGVGKVKAASIVEFRKGHCFLNVGELSLVKGIGSKTIAKNDLTAGKCK